MDELDQMLLGRQLALENLVGVLLLKTAALNLSPSAFLNGVFANVEANLQTARAGAKPEDLPITDAAMNALEEFKRVFAQSAMSQPRGSA